MKQITSLISTMPMYSASRCPDNISNIQSLWLSTLITNPTRSSSDFEDLAILMVMPMSPCARSEHDVVDGNSLSFVGEDWIGPDVTGERGSTEFGLFALRTGVSDNCHRHVGSVGYLQRGLCSDSVIWGFRGLLDRQMVKGFPFYECRDESAVCGVGEGSLTHKAVAYQPITRTFSGSPPPSSRPGINKTAEKGRRTRQFFGAINVFRNFEPRGIPLTAGDMK
jgi:hypothetical protein